ncbi:restriction endonuclease subunit M, partial [Amaricoccus sp. HAR-UPW-R2A-40]
LRRIVEASSNPGDIVLDCFCGSGTALVAADMLERKWIGVDNSPEALRTMLGRFEHGTKPMGDFVGKQTPKREAASGSLFDVELPKVPTMPPHRIEDFALFVAPDLLPHIRPVLFVGRGGGIGGIFRSR